MTMSVMLGMHLNNSSGEFMRNPMTEQKKKRKKNESYIISVQVESVYKLIIALHIDK